MKYTLKIAMALLGLMWLPYSSLFAGISGNPNRTPYIGQPDSSWPADRNPPKANGVATYNPYGPLPAPSPSPVATPSH